MSAENPKISGIGTPVLPQAVQQSQATQFQGNEDNKSSGGGIGSVVLPLAAGGAGLAGGYYYGEAPKVDQFVNSKKVEASGNLTAEQKTALETMNTELSRTSTEANAQADKIFVDKDGKAVTELSAQEFLGATEKEFKDKLDADKKLTDGLQKTAKETEKAVSEAKAAEDAARAEAKTAQEEFLKIAKKFEGQKNITDPEYLKAQQKAQEAGSKLVAATNARVQAETASKAAGEALATHTASIAERETRLGCIKDGKVAKETFVSKTLANLRASFAKEDSVFGKAFKAVKGLFPRVRSWKVGGIAGAALLGIGLLASYFLSGSSKETQQA